MRPPILNPLFAGADSLPGVGPKIAKLIGKLAGSRVVDLIWHLPTGIIDRRAKPNIADLREHQAGSIVTLDLTVEAHQPSRNKRLPYKVRCRDGGGAIDLVFFHARKDYLQRLLPEGGRRIVSGRLEHYGGLWQIPHPDHVVAPEDAADLPEIEPIYPLTQGLGRKALLRAVRAALGKAPDLPEWLEAELIGWHNWPSWQQAVEATHSPVPTDGLDQNPPGRRRLAYDELLASQLALALIRRAISHRAGRATPPDPAAKGKIIKRAGFALTPGQQTAFAEVEGNMASSDRMLRLLQGDVGAGKTLVAALAMANTLAAGRQALLMAPTELLARQHHATLNRLFADFGNGIEDICTLLTGRDTAAQRRRALPELASGAAKLAVGTHALFQEGVEFQDVGLVVIDEQHRFGVHQRMRLQERAPDADILVMTATPIPRTLTLALYGEMSVSRIHGKPPGRQAIDTRALPLERVDAVSQALARKLSDGERVYWICPMIEETGDSDLTAATARYDALARRFPGQAGLLHGGMATADKDAAMQAFAGGDIAVLVATTVVEVGIDVPEATTIVIEHAERFGLAQLHQLRGRVGRGERAGVCLLLYAPPLSETAQARLETLRRSDDGFEIAEEDLRLRGGGDLLGTRQSGLPDFKLADFEIDGDLLAAAAEEARTIAETDPDLKGPRGPALKVLLHLFERGAAIRRARSG